MFSNWCSQSLSEIFSAGSSQLERSLQKYFNIMALFVIATYQNLPTKFYIFCPNPGLGFHYSRYLLTDHLLGKLPKIGKKFFGTTKVELCPL